MALPSSAVPVDDVVDLVAGVLGLPPGQVDPDTALTVLGLESFTAVRLRRRLRDLGVDLPMTAFLGNATARTIAAGITNPDTGQHTTPSPDPGQGTAPGPDPEQHATPGSNPGQVPSPDADYPLTPLQTAYWIGRDRAFPLGGVATFYYREYDRVAAEPEADLAALAAGWNRLVDHHPMLRMVVDGRGRQRVLPSVGDYEIQVEDLRGLEAERVEQRLAELRHARSHQVRPADRWPLFDLGAAFLPGGRTRIFLGVDVLALDLTGWMQLLTEWGAVVADPALALPGSPVSFPELVARLQEDPGASRRRARDEEYWRARDLPPGPGLPWTRELAEVRSHRFTRAPAELDVAEWEALRERAARRGLSPTGVLLAACGLVLARWGADGPFCLNTTLFDRPDEPELAHLVGDFTSTVLVEIPQPDLREWEGFGDFAAQVNRRFWTDMEHSSVSGVEVRRDGGLTPVHPVVFTSGLGLTEPGSAPAGWLGEEVYGVSQTPQVALDHIVHDEAGRLRIAWDAVEGLLPDGFVEGMRDAHLRLLRRLATSEESWTDVTLGWDPSFLPEEPLTCRPFGESGPLLNDPLRTAARTVPDEPALLFAGSGPGSSKTALLADGSGITHGELGELVARIGSALASRGLGPGDLVAVAFDKCPEQVIALLGVCASGAGYVPVEPSWPADRIAAVCGQAAIVHAVVPDDDTTVWPEGVTVHRLSRCLAGGEATARRASADELAYVIFTSGSTGRPKGVAIEHRAARTTIDDLIDRFPLGVRDRVLGLSAFSFDLSVHDIFGVMGTGAALVLPDASRQRDPGHWLDLMELHRVTVWNTAPALMEMLVEYAELEPERTREALSSLRLVLLSADWIPVTLPDRIRALAPDARIVSLGGATEAAIWSICFPVERVPPSWPSIPYGRALRGQCFHILDSRGRPCPVGVSGELHIGGDGLARGYIGDARQTRERFVIDQVLGRRLYRTGDLGRWRADGTIEFLGRLDRQVKIRGHRIELGEVESALDRAPGVRHSVALALPGPDDRPRLVAFVVSDPAAPPTDEDLSTRLRERLPDYMVPARFVHLPDFPVTPNGKIDYRSLPNPYRRPTRPTDTPPASQPQASRPQSSQPQASPPPASQPQASPPPASQPQASPPPASQPQASPPPASLPQSSQPQASPSPGFEARAEVVPSGENGSGGEAGLAALIREAVGQGLEVTLRITAGSLSPARALTAAGTCASTLRAAAAHRGLVLGERLASDALIELTTRHESVPPEDPTVTPLPARQTGSARVAESGPVRTTAEKRGSAEPASGGLGVAPQTGPETRPEAGIERTITEVLGELLGGAPIDVEVPFFQLGASSLTLVRARARLVELLDPRLEVVDMFGHPTVRQLAAHIASKRRRTSEPPPQPPAEERVNRRRAARRRAVEVAG